MSHENSRNLLLSFAVVLSHATENFMPEPELVEASCSFIVSASGKDSTFVPVPGLSVLHPPPSPPQLDIQPDPGVSMDGVVCWRSRAEIGPNDDWVVRTGVPLYVKQDQGGLKALCLCWSSRRLAIGFGSFPGQNSPRNRLTRSGRALRASICVARVAPSHSFKSDPFSGVG